MPAEAPLPLTEEATKSITDVGNDAADAEADLTATPPKQRTYLSKEELTPAEKVSLREESTQFIKALLK